MGGSSEWEHQMTARLSTTAIFGSLGSTSSETLETVNITWRYGTPCRSVTDEWLIHVKIRFCPARLSHASFALTWPSCLVWGA